jgi:hypothetical protein
MTAEFSVSSHLAGAMGEAPRIAAEGRRQRHSRAWLNAAFGTARRADLRCGPQLRLRDAYAGHPRHLVVLEAVLVDEAGDSIWWGDLNLTNDEARLAELAATLGATICVVGPWHGALHGSGDEFDAADAIARFTPDGRVLASRWRGRFDRDRSGRIVRPGR